MGWCRQLRGATYWKFFVCLSKNLLTVTSSLSMSSDAKHRSHCCKLTRSWNFYYNSKKDRCTIIKASTKLCSNIEDGNMAFSSITFFYLWFETKNLSEVKNNISRCSWQFNANKFTLLWNFNRINNTRDTIILQKYEFEEPRFSSVYRYKLYHCTNRQSKQLIQSQRKGMKPVLSKKDNPTYRHPK